MIELAGMKKGYLLLIFVSLLCLVVGCSFAGKRKVIYAFDKDFPPFSFVDEGKNTGFDLEILKVVLADKNVELVVEPMTWQEAQQALAKRRVHVVSAMDKTAERMKVYRFPDTPYVDYRLSIFTKPGARIESVKDLKGKRVATQKSTTYQDFLRGLKGVNIHLFETELEAIDALKKNKADAYVGAYEVASYYLKKTGRQGIRSTGRPLKITPMYFAVRKRDSELVKMIDDGLKAIKASGEYDRIYRQWFLY